jgi:hypothetical protein
MIRWEPILSPAERFSEVLFGLIMVLSITGSLSVGGAGQEDVRMMLVGALGCNTAWGLVDAVMYLVTTLVERFRLRSLLDTLRSEPEPQRGHEMIAARMPPLLAESMSPAELEHVRQRLLARKDLPAKGLDRRDLLRGAGHLPPGVSLHPAGGVAVPVSAGAAGGASRLQRNGDPSALPGGVPGRQVHELPAGARGAGDGRHRGGAGRGHHRPGWMSGRVSPLASEAARRARAPRRGAWLTPPESPGRGDRCLVPQTRASRRRPGQCAAGHRSGGWGRAGAPEARRRSAWRREPLVICRAPDGRLG